MVNVSESLGGKMLNDTALGFKWVRAFNESSNYIELHVSNYSADWVKVFSTVDLEQSTEGSGVSMFLTEFPQRFNLHAAVWYNSSDHMDGDSDHMAH